MTTSRQPTFFEKTVNAKGKNVYLFTKRLNPKAGTFPLFKERVKLKMDATTDAEAVREAKTLAAELELLQEVSRKDGKHVTSTKDKNKAAETWVRVVAGVDVSSARGLKGKATKEAMEARETLDFLVDEVTSFYGSTELDHEGGYNQWLSDFGDHLLKFLKDGQGVGSISESVSLYLKQTQRDHLDDKTASVRAAHRVVGYFVGTIGDKQLDQISRKDVERYITQRLDVVKTTSVQRELSTLSSMWNKCAQALDLRVLNPFANQPIRGLGSDAEERHTPTVSETKELLAALEDKAAKAPKSYVWPLVAIAALTGCRLSEAWGLLPVDFDRETNTLWIQPNSKRKSLKTKNSSRPIPVLVPLEFWLDRFFKATTEGQGAKTANSASAASVKAIKALGFGFGNHSLRHGMKQRLVEADAPSNVLEELLGWSRQSMASNYGRNQATAAKKNYLASVYRALGVYADADIQSNVVAFKAA
jgi:integrase